MLLTTSLSLLKANGACKNGYKDLVNRLGPKYGMDSPISILSGLGHHSISDVLWTLRAVVPGQQELRDKLSRLIACDIAELVLHIFEDKYPDDNRPRNAIEVARKFTNGLATKKELTAARTGAANAYAYADATYAYVAAAAADTTSATAYAATAYASYTTGTDDSLKPQVEEIIRLHLSG